MKRKMFIEKLKIISFLLQKRPFLKKLVWRVVIGLVTALLVRKMKKWNLEEESLSGTGEKVIYLILTFEIQICYLKNSYRERNENLELKLQILGINSLEIFNAGLLEFLCPVFSLLAIQSLCFLLLR